MALLKRSVRSHSCRDSTSCKRSCKLGSHGLQQVEGSEEACANACSNVFPVVRYSVVPRLSWKLVRYPSMAPAAAQRVTALQLILLFSHIASALAAGGPCSSTTTTVNVVTASDLDKRVRYLNTVTVSLVLQNDLLLNASILFTSRFSCTKLSSQPGSSFTISSLSDAFPALQIRGASNVLIQNVSFRVPVTAASPACARGVLPDVAGNLCPAVYIARSWGVQLVAAPALFGRIDIYRSAGVSVDHVAAETVAGDVAVVRVAFTGQGSRMLPGNVAVTNCDIVGGNVGVLVYKDSCGAVVSNNRLRNQFFAGVQCGATVHNAGDCMLSTFSNNLITLVPPFVPAPDSSAFYFGMHWVSVGNVLSCNYAVNGKHCLYLDWCSSGVTVKGMVCYNTEAGFKLNTGHSNIVNSLVLIGQRLPGWISCQNYDINNCLSDPGSSWEAQRLERYNSPAFQQAYPWLSELCTQTEANGVSCNPEGSPGTNVTGNCSGLPTGNVVQSIIVDPVKPANTPAYLSCAGIVNVSSYNVMTFNKPAFAHAAVLFNDYDNLDLGVRPESPVFAFAPDFISCPKSANGIQPVDPSVYSDNFNVPPPPAA